MAKAKRARKAGTKSKRKTATRAAPKRKTAKRATPRKRKSVRRAPKRKTTKRKTAKRSAKRKTAKRAPRRKSAKRKPAKRGRRKASKKGATRGRAARRARHNPKPGYVRTKAGRVLKVDHTTRSQAGKLLGGRRRKGGKGPTRVKLGPGDFLDTETASYVLHFGRKRAGKKAASPRKHKTFARPRATKPRTRRATAPAGIGGDLVGHLYDRTTGE